MGKVLNNEAIKDALHVQDHKAKELELKTSSIHRVSVFTKRTYPVNTFLGVLGGSLCPTEYWVSGDDRSDLIRWEDDDLSVK